MRKSPGRTSQLLSMSPASVIFALCGLAVVLWLLSENDYRAVLRTVTEAGGGLTIVVAIRSIIIAICGFAWWCLLRALAVYTLRVVRGLLSLCQSIHVL